MAVVYNAFGFSTVSLGLAVGIFGAIAYFLHLVLGIGRRPKHLPPGPPTQVIWGNLKQFDQFFPQYQYTAWASRYGPVYTVMQGNTPHIIVNTAEDARKIFVEQGAQTQNRPPSKFKMLMRDGYFPSSMHGPKWRKARRMWHVILKPTAAKQYVPYHDLESAQLLFDILGEPSRWCNHIERYTNSAGMAIVNGYRITTFDNPMIKETLDDVYDLSRLGFRGRLLDFWPFLWKLPVMWHPICREACSVAKNHRAYIWRNYSSVKRKADQGIGVPSFNQAIQQKLKEGWKDVSEMEGAEIGQHLLSGSTDTAATTLITCIAALCLYPHVQKKAQEEIDRVVGQNRLPQAEDAEKLPYVQQFILEIHRWMPIVPLSLPKVATEPVKWGNYQFPEGTILVMNTYAIHHDPSFYPEPDVFRPERWEGKINLAHADGLLFSFGAGRRVCPGKHLAERSVFMLVSRLLWAFNISHMKDQGGNTISINPRALRPGLVVRLKPFPADIRPRDPERARLIRQVWKEKCDTLLDENHQWKTSPEGVERLIQRNG
ncbi:hypothetical protein LOZ53_003252 [Ophidiomyces ophidiicola]|nr:hypothetical protein LOZ53_003252 [Ophidiomyces ophidiicola]